MCLCAFVSLDEDALVCDFAETYSIYNWRDLPGRYAATLAAGLRHGSRIRMEAEGVKSDMDTSLLAMIHDDITSVLYVMAKTHKKGHVPKPDYISDRVIHGDKKEASKGDYQGFDEADDYEKTWEKIAGHKHQEEVK
jgi:hypothetical protein